MYSCFSCVLNLLSKQKRRNSTQKWREGTAGNVWGQQLRINEKRGTGVLANSDLTCGDKDPGRG